MAKQCDICGKSLGWRRESQGIKRHPRCRRLLPAGDLDHALQETAALLLRLADQPADDDLAGLYLRAADQASELSKDLRQLKDYVVPSMARPSSSH